MWLKRDMHILHMYKNFPPVSKTVLAQALDLANILGPQGPQGWVGGGGGGGLDPWVAGARGPMHMCRRQAECSLANNSEDVNNKRST